MCQLLHVEQRANTDCGQVCVAMLAQVPLATAVKAVGHDRPTRTADIRRGLSKLGIAVGPRRVRMHNHRLLPSPCLVFFEDTAGKLRHWTVYAHGEFWDPLEAGPIPTDEYLACHALGKPLSFLTICQGWPRCEYHQLNYSDERKR